MPPVFGPVSPSPARLKSCAGSSGTAASPSVTTKSETSGPARYSSTTTRPHSWACPSAAALSSVTTTPLPAARPSFLTTNGGPNSSSARPTSSASVQACARAVGTPAAVITSLANALDPSSRAASALGPNTAIPLARTASATPATSGASGPITTRSACSSTASAATAAGSAASTARSSATAAIPGFPGAAISCSTDGSSTSRSARACSRPPPPSNKTRTTRHPTHPLPRPVDHEVCVATRRGMSDQQSHDRPVRGRVVAASATDGLPDGPRDVVGAEGVRPGETQDRPAGVDHAVLPATVREDRLRGAVRIPAVRLGDHPGTTPTQITDTEQIAVLVTHLQLEHVRRHPAVDTAQSGTGLQRRLRPTVRLGQMVAGRHRTTPPSDQSSGSRTDRPARRAAG